MATRRMFSKRLINSARFVKMPASTQNLYFHLGMNADDDGIVEAYNIIKYTGCSEDDLKVLVAKGFVIVLNEDLVTYICDWKENNLIRADRKVDSYYKDLLVEKVENVELIEKKQRADVKPKTLENSGFEATLTTDGQPMDNQWTTNGQPMDNQWTDNGRHRLGKVRLGKDNIYIYGGENCENETEMCDAERVTAQTDEIDEIDQHEKPKKKKKANRFIPPSVEEVLNYCKSRNNAVDPQHFVDYYTSNGWLVGKNKMKDWKAAVRTWERNGYSTPQKNNIRSPNQQNVNSEIIAWAERNGHRKGHVSE